MKICMTHYAFYPTTGGVESHLLDLCTELAVQGHEVHALVGSMEGQPADGQIEGVHIHRRRWMNPEVVRKFKTRAGVEEEEVSPVALAGIKAKYKNFIEHHDIDVVHSHNFHHFLPEYGLALTRLREEMGIPTFLTVHEMWGEFLCGDLLKRTNWDTVIAVGQHVYGDVIAQVPGVDNLVLINHGIDTNMFSPVVTGEGLRRELSLEGKRIILHPARLLPWKGVHLTVEAMRTVIERYPDVHLIVTDTQEIVDWVNELEGYRERVLEMIEEYGLQGHITMKSFDFFDLPHAYAMAEIVVYPTSGEEPFGLVPLEAMASQKPVIVSRSGGLVESVIDGVTGFVTAKGNAEQLADRLLVLLENPQLGQRFGREGRRLVKKDFSRDRMAEEVMELYEQALEARETTLVSGSPERV